MGSNTRSAINPYGGAGVEEEEEACVRGLSADGSTVISTSAIVTIASSTQHTVVIHERLRGTTLVVMYDGRILPSQTRTLAVPHPSQAGAAAAAGGGAGGGAFGGASRRLGGSGAAAGADENHHQGMRGGAGAGPGATGMEWGEAGVRAGGAGELTQTQQQQQQQQQTELVFSTPSHLDGGEDVVGLAWVVAILDNTDDEGSASRRSNPNSLTNTGTPPPLEAPSHFAAHYVEAQPADSGDGELECEMVRVGAAVPLLLMPDAGVAAEVNAAAAQLRATMGAGKANAFIVRLGSCVMTSTANTDDVMFVLDVTQVFNLALTKKMLLDTYFDPSGSGGKGAVGGGARGRRCEDDEISVVGLHKLKPVLAHSLNAHGFNP
jgi:hypothetical protein